ncbi:MAG TPA: hypothetical protein VIO35_04905 [Chloroflexota bacterium]
METKRKMVYRLSEIAELKEHLRAPLSPDELRQRQELLDRIDGFRESGPILQGDLKIWIKQERGDVPDG